MHPKLNDMEEEESYSYAMQLASSIALPMVLKAVIELKVFDIMAKSGPDAKLSAMDIAAQTTSKNPEAATMLDRMLRLLATYSVLHCSLVEDQQKLGSFQRLYSLNSVSKYFVEDDDGMSLGNYTALLHDKVFLDSWSQLKEAVVEGGIPFNRVHGCHAFEYPRGCQWILYDWSDERCLKCLKNCYDAIPQDGKVIIVEAVAPILPETSSAAKNISYLDALMMTQIPGGKERTKQEFLELAIAAGFNSVKFDCNVCNQWVIEFLK
ncbi:hypothetical protein L6164_036621 [Bauhinia variegata]|uniref:Uncharacterized protein n=1 Tax=Bauhinia variegata TaxID=167791 RepID=A0ACB9KHH7_BAUVA|nr:hypothetical protein L6164_036621 [Bauhinia variegata]